VILFGSALLMKLMERFPIFVLIGAGLIGWVAGEMIISDPAIKPWIDTNAAILHWGSPIVFTVIVVATGKLLDRIAARKASAPDIALP